MIDLLAALAIAGGGAYALIATLSWVIDQDAIGPVGWALDALASRRAQKALPKEMRGLGADQLSALYTTAQLRAVASVFRCEAGRVPNNVRDALSQRQATDALEKQP